MKIKLENREYELKANGSFMKKYQETFGENMIVALYKCSQQQDILTGAKLTYCAIDEKKSFDEWIDSFESPIFLMSEMNNIIDYLVGKTKATVDTKEENPKKK